MSERVIKFRGFHKFGGVSGWVFGNAFIDEHGYYITQPHTSYQVEQKSFGQFTGLTDRQGKEIYEGDILRYRYSRDMSGKDIIEFEEVVEWENDMEWSGFSIHKTMDHEIIGNIYEHPHLLNQGEGDERSVASKA